MAFNILQYGLVKGSLRGSGRLYLHADGLDAEAGEEVGPQLRLHGLQAHGVLLGGDDAVGTEAGEGAVDALDVAGAEGVVVGEGKALHAGRAAEEEVVAEGFGMGDGREEEQGLALHSGGFLDAGLPAPGLEGEVGDAAVEERLAGPDGDRRTLAGGTLGDDDGLGTAGGTGALAQTATAAKGQLRFTWRGSSPMSAAVWPPSARR